MVDKFELFDKYYKELYLSFMVFVNKINVLEVIIYKKGIVCEVVFWKIWYFCVMIMFIINV